MFAPAAYEAADSRAIVRAYPFAYLVTADDAGLHATPTPIFFETDDPDENRLVGHIARRNPQANGLRRQLPALALFSGPHAYISGAWYEERREVPTWNYVAAEVRGMLEPLDNPEENRRVLERTAEKLNDGSSAVWTLDDAPDGRVETLLPHIRSFRITIREICGVTKLSQTHPPHDRARVVDELNRRGSGDDVEIARLMTAHRN